MTVPLIARAAAALTSAHLVAFLGRRRWFAKAEGAAQSARISGLVPLPWGDGALGVARVAVTVRGHEHEYQVPIAARHVPPSNLDAQSRIASVTLDNHELAIFDAVDDPDFQRGFARALSVGAVAEGDAGLRWVVEPTGNHGPMIPADAEIRVASGEQSNTSIVFARTAILKLFRRLQPGIHPEAELCGFLTMRARFANTPSVLATVRFEERVAGAAPQHTVAGLVQEYLPGSTDAWGYAVERGAAYFTAARDAEPANEFMLDAKALGGLTRQMHDALTFDESDPVFAPQPATADDLDRWAHRAQQAIREGLTLLESQLAAKALSSGRVAEAKILVERRDNYLDWVNELADSLGDDLGALIRVHGDYHLGQVLRTATGHFMVIDFEGEPTRPLEERREKASPLKDVAGMLRSFAYAAAALGMTIEKSADMGTRELRIGRWERDARNAFLDGYLHDDSPRRLLPRALDHADKLIALFETEKVFYELAYELNHRRDWAWIPMRGISKLLVRQPDSRTQ